MCAMENKNHVVNSRVVHKLSVTTPDPLLVSSYLDLIAKAYNVPWESASVEKIIGTLGSEEKKEEQSSECEEKVLFLFNFSFQLRQSKYLKSRKTSFLILMI